VLVEFSSAVRPVQKFDPSAGPVFRLLATGTNGTSQGYDWKLGRCCDTAQIVDLLLFVAFIVINLLFIHTTLFKPLKLLTTFLHEFGHATACWLTCGKVASISVETNEGGVTKTLGGSQWIILPAGYLGSSFWGFFFSLWRLLMTFLLRLELHF